MQTPRPDPALDLGLLFISFLQFYGKESHFDITSHAVDLSSTTGFTPKDSAQATLDPAARAEGRTRLCALEPSLSNDVGVGCYRISQLLQKLLEIKVQLEAMGAMAKAQHTEVLSLQVRFRTSRVLWPFSEVSLGLVVILSPGLTLACIAMLCCVGLPHLR
jgi:hypothetical protein